MNKTVSFTRGLKLSVLGALALGLAACTTPFRADVSRFESQLPAPQGQSFFVVADDPALAGGLEFALYADQVEAQMERLGYAQAPSAEAASLLVRFDYGVDEGRERIRSSSLGYGGFGYGGFGYGRFGYGGFGYPGYYGRGYRYSRLGYYHGGPWAYGWHDPFFDGGYDSYTVYTSGIEVKIDDTATGTRLFEGQAEAASRSNRLQYLVPNLVEAMFTDFPGNSGETVRISIAPEDQPVRRGER